jgi:putative PIN family toxin of toxin-antitoxin system
MNRAVLDTNVLVSGLLSPGGPPATLLDEIAAGNLTPVYSDPIFEEYAEVLLRPALRLDPDAVLELLLLFGEVAEYISPGNDTLYGVDHSDFPDMDDLPFYAAALAAHCPLVTGNRKHFPDSGPVEVLNPGDFVRVLGKR